MPSRALKKFIRRWAIEHPNHEIKDFFRKGKPPLMTDGETDYQYNCQPFVFYALLEGSATGPTPEASIAAVGKDVKSLPATSQNIVDRGGDHARVWPELKQVLLVV